MQKKYILFFLLIFMCGKSYGNDSIRESVKSRGVIIRTSPFTLYDVNVIQKKDWTSLIKIPEHPTFDLLLTSKKEKELLTEINERRLEVGKDTLFASDIFYIWNPYFKWLRYNDPHYLINLLTFTKAEEGINSNYMPSLFFDYVMINDTIIVDRSDDPLFKKGDMILSINQKNISEYIKYNYEFRYNSIFHFMKFYYFNNIRDTFKVELIRNNNNLLIETTGLKNEFKGWDYDIKTFQNAKCGYINIGSFDDNKQLIKTLQTTIKKFKKDGYNNVILDLRKNPGGSGDEFDKLMSIFINKSVIQYQKGAKIKVSKEVLQDYDFLTEEMIGKLVDLPESEIVKEFKTKPKMFIDGITYYVLMSENTGSTAVTFVNMLQYNNAAKLVGEPLLHNALKYGEVINGNILAEKDFCPTLAYALGISTIEYDEYTKAVDGVIMPDIHIPYVAKDYLSGKDAMLEKLLKMLKNK